MSDRRFLDGNLTSPVQPVPINAFDVETTGRKNKFLMGSIVGDSTLRGEPEVFFDKREMLQALLSRRFREGHIYATNLEFDLMALLDEHNRGVLETWGYDFEMFHNGAQLIYGRIKDQSKHTWEFRDSLNLAPHMGVAAMGEIIDLPKLDIDFSEVDASEVSRERLVEYNIRDSRITYEFLTWLQDEINSLGGNMEITSAKTALNLFRREYLPRPIEQPPLDMVQRAYEGYYGGRVSPLIQGHSEGPIHEYDVASLYPYCMSVETFPDTNSISYDRGNGRHSEDAQRTRIWASEGMTRATVTAPEMDIPILPYRLEDKLLFPVGTFTGWFCHNELRYALENGYTVDTVHESMWTDNSFNPFEGYVDSLFEKRLQYKEEGNEAEIAVKLMMNALYGKFGQKLDGDGGVYRPIGDSKIEDLVGKTVVGDWVVDPLDEGDDTVPGFINPMLASYVTARGRIELYKWMDLAQERGGDVFYCDTDSVYTDVELPTSPDKNLGEMDYEGTYTDLWVFGPKLYIAQPENKSGPKITAKGVPYKVMDKMWSALQDGRQQVEYEKLAGMRESFRRGWTPNEVVDQHRSVEITQATKRVHSRPADHHTMMTEQVRTEPFRIDGAEIEGETPLIEGKL